MIEIKRNTTTIATSSDYNYSGQHMGSKVVNITVESVTPIAFLEGDYVLYRGETFILTNVPTGNKVFSSLNIKYTLQFKHVSYKLNQISFLDVVPSGSPNEAYYNNTGEVAFVGTVENLMGRIKANLDRIDAGWTYEIDPSVVLTENQVVLDNKYCSDALLLVNSLYGLDYWITNKHIKVGGTAIQVGGVFEYGRTGGICELTRTAEDKAVITRARVYGSSRNIPSDYNVTDAYKYNPRLMLPNFKTSGINYVDSPLLDANNIKEGILFNDDIFPTIDDGTSINEIVQVDTIEEDAAGFTIYIKDIGFDINDKLTQEVATLSMTTGYLKGYEFEISSVTPDATVVGAAYKLILKRDTSIENTPLPNNITRIKSGDKYVLLNIKMDESYVLAAEQRLLNWANEQFSIENIDKYKTSYSAKFAQEYIARNPSIETNIKEGNLIHITDVEFGVDKQIIIQSLSINNAVYPPTYDLTIADTVVASRFSLIEEQQKTQQQILTYKAKSDETKARRTNSNLRILEEENKATFFGLEATNFVLEAKLFTDYQGDPNKVLATAGELRHRGSDFFWGGIDDTVHRLWTIPTQVTPILLPDSTYIAYIKANKLDGSASWEISEVAIESDSSYFYFEAGTLFPTVAGKRDSQMTHGVTIISGSNIYSGKTQSLDGASYADWENGKFKFGSASKGIDWGVTQEDTLTIKGGLVQSPAGITQPIGVWRGDWVSGTPYYVGDEVHYQGSSYVCVLNNTGDLPTSGSFEIKTAQGEPFQIDEQGLAANRPDASTLPVGYTYFATDTSLLYFVESGVPNVWSSGTEFGKGEDGQTFYTWVRYADVLDRTIGHSGKTIGVAGKTIGFKGGNILPNNEGAVYLGVAYNKASPTPSNNQADYTWSRILGFNGIDGANGTNGIDGSDGVDGTNGYSIVWQGEFASHPNNPQNGWAYKNTTDKKSYTYRDGSWYQMNIDGSDGIDGNDGLSIVWKGASSTPPVSPEKNWVYKDTDNGITYIYTGTAWEVMVNDGDGIDVQYSTDGANWHDSFQSGDIYLRQNVLGVWSSAIRFVGSDGVDGADGVDGTNGYSIVWQGEFASHPNNPQNGWAYKNTTDKKSYTYRDGSWYQMNIDGQDGIDGNDGISIVWKGESSSAPLDPEKNWVYRDTDNGVTYIYTGTAWEIMVNDGEGVDVQYSIDGANWHDSFQTGDIYLRQYVLGVWSPAIRFVGSDGNDGAGGNYIEYQYAKNGSTTTPPSVVTTDLNPSGWSKTPPTIGPLEYLWMITATKNHDGTSLVVNWTTGVRVSGINGADGADGIDGATGPLSTGGLAYSPSKTYYGNNIRVDIVTYLGGTYVARTDAGTFSGVLPTDTSKWNVFGGQYESLATELFFADFALVNNLGVRDLTTGEDGQGDPFVYGNFYFVGNVVSYNGRTYYCKANNINQYPTNTIYWGLGFKSISLSSSDNTMRFNDIEGEEVLVIDDGVGYEGGTGAGLEVRKNGNVSIISIDGVFSNAGNTQCLPLSSGITAKASLCGLGFGDVSGSNNFLTGVYGAAFNSGTAPTYAGYFNGGTRLNGAVYNAVKKVSTSYTLDENDYIVMQSSSGSVSLPTVNRLDGRTVIIKRRGSAEFTVIGNGASIYYENSNVSSIVFDRRFGESMTFVWDGGVWVAISALD